MDLKSENPKWLLLDEWPHVMYMEWLTSISCQGWNVSMLDDILGPAIQSPDSPPAVCALVDPITSTWTLSLACLFQQHVDHSTTDVDKKSVKGVSMVFHKYQYDQSLPWNRHAGILTLCC